METLQQWGFQVMIGKTVGSKSTNYFSGTNEERKDELQALLDEPSIKAILCGRGGYGVTRIIDQLNFSAFKKIQNGLSALVISPFCTRTY